MPRGPKGQKRPADVIGNAVHVMRVATGEITEQLDNRAAAAVVRGRAGGVKGGPARAVNLSPQERKQIAKRAAQKRWGKH